MSDPNATPRPAGPAGDEANHRLRQPCRCGATVGRIDTRHGQDCVFCAGCGRFQYNAPRIETGRAVRTLASRPGITPSQRMRVFARHASTCLCCGRRPPTVELVVGHIIPRQLAARYTALDGAADSEWNAMPQCVECNAGWDYAPDPDVIARALAVNAAAFLAEHGRAG